jgi:hypothetical protein
MTRRAARSLLIAAAPFVALCTILHAQEPLAPERVRGVDGGAKLLVRELLERSSTARDLAGALGESDVVVYVRHRLFGTKAIRGRIGLVASDATRRVLAIEIAQQQTVDDQLVSLAHELRHAVEIADEPTVRDSNALSVLYMRIGEPTGVAEAGYESYETQAAADTGRRVRRELFEPRAEADAAGRN